MVTIVVDETGDQEFSETGTTLREAITIANQTGGADRIEFDAGVFTGGDASLIRLGSTLIIDESVTIDASFAGGVTITGDTAGDDILRTGELITDVFATTSAALEDNVRVIGISDAAANTSTTLIGLTITGGRTTGSNAGTNLDPDSATATSTGGGISVQEGDLTLINSNVSGNSTENGEGGGIAGDQRIDLTGEGSDDFIRIFSSTVGYNLSEGARGGGVFGSFVEITNSTIVGNATRTSFAEGGGVFGGIGVILKNATIIGNHTDGYNSFGGGVAGPNDLYVTNSTITGNWTEGSNAVGGGLSAFGTGQVDNAVINDTKQIINSIIIGNETRDDGVADNNARLNATENNIFEGQNLINDFRFDFDIIGEGGFTSASLGAVFANIVDGRVVLTDNLGPVLTAELLNSASNPAIDASGRVATDADATGRPAQDFLNVGASSLPGIRDLGAFEVPVLAGGLPMIEGTDLADILTATTLEELIDLLGGADIVIGSAAELNGDRITGFGDDDKLIVRGASFGEDDVVIEMGSAILNIDTTGDAAADTVVTLEGDFSAAAFQFLPADNGTEITVDMDGGAPVDGDPDATPDPADDPNDTGDPPVSAGPTEGDDLLVGTTADDTIRALGGDDTIKGLAGDDLLVGGGGRDSITGNGGEDRLRGNGGDDTLKGGGGADNIKGGGGSDNIKGNGGSDAIKAGGGADIVKGGGGADQINGGGGADRLNGGGGNDTLSGRGGDDRLKGNGGADVFQFRASDRDDTILDFRQGQDKIEIQSGAKSFAALDIVQDGADVLIGFGAGQVRVITDNADAFDDSDFIF